MAVGQSDVVQSQASAQAIIEKSHGLQALFGAGDVSKPGEGFHLLVNHSEFGFLGECPGCAAPKLRRPGSVGALSAD
jgi:hypothetical protein